jgi:2'-5' RNA ligase
MRTFIAVDVSSSAVARLQNEIMSSAQWGTRDIKPVEAKNLHFTIIFLGEKSDSEVSKIKDKMAEVHFEPFVLTYVGVGAFPKPASARVVWVGVDPKGEQKLTALANDVIAKMADLGFSADKPFSPHMTLFRTKGRPVAISDIAAKYQGRTFDSDLIDKVHLKKSDLSPSGPTYSNIYTVEAKK